MSVAAHIDDIFVRTDTTAPTASDRIDGITDASLSEPVDMVEGSYLGGGGYKVRYPTLRDTSLDLSMQFKTANAGQQLLRSGRDNGTLLYVTVQLDSSATAGSKGKRIPMLVAEYSEKLTPGDVVQATCKLVGNGAPVAV